jgi:hypothetical protein
MMRPHQRGVQIGLSAGIVDHGSSQSLEVAGIPGGLTLEWEGRKAVANLKKRH